MNVFVRWHSDKKDITHAIQAMQTNEDLQPCASKPVTKSTILVTIEELGNTYGCAFIYGTGETWTVELLCVINQAELLIHSIYTQAQSLNIHKVIFPSSPSLILYFTRVLFTPTEDTKDLMDSAASFLPSTAVSCHAESCRGVFLHVDIKHNTMTIKQ